MPNTFTDGAVDKIIKGVNKALDTPGNPNSDRRYQSYILGKGGAAGFGSPLSIGKVGYGGIAASSTDWATRSFGPVTLFGFHANRSNTPEANTGAGEGANPAGQSFDEDNDVLWGQNQKKPKRQNGGVVMAWNPGCSVITQGTPVIMGQDAMGNYIIIFEMCPCTSYG